MSQPPDAPHPEVLRAAEPRRTHDGGACFEADLRSAPQHEDGGDWTEPTTLYWQAIEERAQPPAPPFRFGYPAALPDGRYLVLPIRPLPGGEAAVASLIANQASFSVVRTLAEHMTTLARSRDTDVVVGLPTLGLAFAPLVAEGLGHGRFVPLGYSRKYWYDEALSEPVSSITSPDSGKRIYLDPNQIDLLRGRRIVVVDDAVSSGSTIAAVARLFAQLELDIAGIVVAMKQSERWRIPLTAIDARLPDRVDGVLSCPRFRRDPEGWVPE